MLSFKMKKKAPEDLKTAIPEAFTVYTVPESLEDRSYAGEHSATEPAQEEQQQSKPQPQQNKYLVVSVHEARNLVAKDYDTHSSDPFVKISLGGVSRKTRVIYRNCHPLWGQRLVFPTDGLSEAEPLLVELFDKDFNSKEFLGQVMMTLGKALEIADDEEQREQYWFRVSKKHSTDIVGGELCLGFEVRPMAPQQYLQAMSELEALLDPEVLVSTYSGKSLHLQLKGINGLAASGLCGSGAKPAAVGAPQPPQQQGLTLYVKYGRVMLEKQLPPLPANAPADDDVPSPRSTEGSCELPVNEEVIIPLATAAAKAGHLVTRKKEELYDVKVYLKSQGTLIAKTQIPITSIPTASATSSKSAGTGSVATTLDDTISCCSPRPVSLSPPVSARVTNDCQMSNLETAAASAGGLVMEGSIYPTSSSMPATPRGTGSDFSLAAAYPASSGNRGSCIPQTPDLLAFVSVPRSSSDAAALNKRLASTAATWSNGGNGSGSCGGGIATSLSMLSNSSSLKSSLGVNVSKGQLVEGSLGSVTACSRGQVVVSPAGLQRRKVQGLAELHDMSFQMKNPFKAMLMPPREVSRMGWIPTKAAEDSSEEGGSEGPKAAGRSFCRIMESTVPMYCNLEISLNLSIVPQRQAQADIPNTELAAGIPAEDGCEDDEETDEETSNANVTPIDLPQPYQVVLQDVTLQGIGVNRLHALLLSAKSELMESHYAAQELSDVTVGPWRPAPDCSGYQRVRNVSYVKRLKIPLPLAPDKCHVWEEHRVLVKNSGGWVAQLVCTNDAPKGDCFEALVQLCGVYAGANSSRLRISMELKWTKNTWGKSMVQGGAESDAQRGWEALVKSLRKCANSSSTDDLVATSRQQPSALSAPQVANAVAAAHTPTRKSAGVLGCLLEAPSHSQVVILLHVLLLLVLLLLVWVVSSGARDIVQELYKLNTAVHACSVPKPL